MEREHRPGLEGRSPAPVIQSTPSPRQEQDVPSHQAGVELLHSAAARAQGGVREADTVARRGCDEFVLLPDGQSEPAEAEVAATRIQDAPGQIHWLGDHEPMVTAGVGIVLTSAATTTPATLLEAADSAMYQAKAAGAAARECPPGQLGLVAASLSPAAAV